MTTAIDIFKQYPTTQYIPLVPVQTITQLSPLHMPSINLVRISADEADKDVYKQGDGLALTKNGLMKLAAAAYIQIEEIKEISPSSCEKCLEMARATGKPPTTGCAACPCGSDVACEVTISIPDIAGGVRYIKASREFICKDEQEKMKTKEAQYRQAFFFRRAITESKAMLRAIRAALMIKSSYKARELGKTFAVPVIVPDFSNPEMRAAAIERYRSGVNALYGQTDTSHSLPPGAVVEEVNADFDDAALDAEVDRMTQSLPPIPAEAIDPSEFDFPSDPCSGAECHECGAIIEDWTKKSTGEVWPAERIIQAGVKNFGKPLCSGCYFKARKAKGGAAA